MSRKKKDKKIQSLEDHLMFNFGNKLSECKDNDQKLLLFETFLDTIDCFDVLDSDDIIDMLETKAKKCGDEFVKQMYEDEVLRIKIVEGY